MDTINDNKWIIAAFTFSAISIFITFFLEGDVKIFAYVVSSMVFALFFIIQSQKDQKQKQKNE